MHGASYEKLDYIAVSVITKKGKMLALTIIVNAEWLCSFGNAGKISSNFLLLSTCVIYPSCLD